MWEGAGFGTYFEDLLTDWMWGMRGRQESRWTLRCLAWCLEGWNCCILGWGRHWEVLKRMGVLSPSCRLSLCLGPRVGVSSPVQEGLGGQGPGPGMGQVGRVLVDCL